MGKLNFRESCVTGASKELLMIAVGVVGCDLTWVHKQSEERGAILNLFLHLCNGCCVSTNPRPVREHQLLTVWCSKALLPAQALFAFFAGTDVNASVSIQSQWKYSHCPLILYCYTVHRSLAVSKGFQMVKLMAHFPIVSAMKIGRHLYIVYRH